MTSLTLLSTPCPTLPFRWVCRAEALAGWAAPGSPWGQGRVALPRACPPPPATGSCTLFHSSLRPLDIEFMKRLSKVVNIVPVIAKADTLTLEERLYFKQRVGLHRPWPRPRPSALGPRTQHTRI